MGASKAKIGPLNRGPAACPRWMWSMEDTQREWSRVLVVQSAEAAPIPPYFLRSRKSEEIRKTLLRLRPAVRAIFFTWSSLAFT